MFQRLLPSTLRAYIPLLAALTLSSLLSFVLYIFRVMHTGQNTFFFLNWNLFLAWIPLVCALVAWHLSSQRKQPNQRPSGRVMMVLVIWLLFLPNSPYITTDLMHLAWRPTNLLWYDAAMIFLFAWNGLIVGFTSLSIVQALLERWFGALTGWLCVGMALVASSFGIYLGRFLNWNSWDIITEPKGLALDILSRLIDPFAHPRTLAVTLLFSGVLLMLYVTMTLLTRTRWEES